MCGIWAFFSKLLATKVMAATAMHGTPVDKVALYSAFSRIKHRGPDRSTFLEINDVLTSFLGFHRLAIMDKSTKGDQPFVIEQEDKTTYCLINGEIYNFKEIKELYDISTKSNSDCEVVPYIYNLMGMGQTLRHIRGEFAIMLIDIYHNQLDNHGNFRMDIHVARDPFGVRPLFYSEDDNSIMFSSEMKGLIGVTDHKKIKQFPPGHWARYRLTVTDGELNIDSSTTCYYDSNAYPLIMDHKFISDPSSVKDPEFITPILKKVKSTFKRCVIDMLEADRDMGALLSGGLDSSLVVSIASKYLRKHGRRLRTFSIGMPGSTDKEYAEMVSKFCDTDHTHIEFSTQDFLDALKKVIYAIESYDITTVRASTGQFLVSEWISKNTDIKVLLIGDGSDELLKGYRYTFLAPSLQESFADNVQLLHEIHFFDVLRADRGVADNGLEARVPFLDYRFVDLCMSLDISLRVPVDGIEKWLLRSAFNNGKYLPEPVLWRKKEAFSDGVSSLEKSWYQITQEHAAEMYHGVDMSKIHEMYEHCPPPTYEALYYRDLFCGFFTNDTAHVIPHFWLPKWSGDIKEPSARVLAVYNSQESLVSSSE